MDPKVWGPKAWFFLHSVTMAYPVKPSQTEQQEMYDFFQNLSKILPCYKCRKHFQMNINKFPLQDAIKSRDELVKWLIDVHNSVNEATGKPKESYKSMIKQINDEYKNGGKLKTKKIFNNTNFSLLIIGIIFLLYISKSK